MLHRRVLVPLVAVVALLGACGSDDASTDTAATDSTPAGSSEKPKVELPDATPTELVVTVLEPGEGPKAVNGDTVVVDYVGVLSDTGEEFDNSYDRGTPFPVTLGSGGVIKGWDQGLVGVQAGSRVQLDIPSDLAYGESGQGDVIGPNAALTFVIDVRAIIGPIDPADAPTDLDLPDATNATELATTDVVEGDGPAVEVGQAAWVAYIAYDSTGKLLENSWESGRPTQFTLDTAATPVPGLVDGITGMKAGGRRIIVIPADQAFDGAGNEQLGLAPGQPLVMVVDLIAIG